LLLWVMSYTARDQRGLLSRLGVDPDGWLWTLKAGMVAMGALAILLIGFAVAARLRRGRKADPAQRAYDRFCRKMAGAGLARDPAEGPRDFAARIVAKRPDLAEEVHAVLERYVRLRYGRPEGRPDLARELERRVRRFSPKPGRSAPAP
jgi:protein-glutamine gamma-glutamyltransferase